MINYTEVLGTTLFAIMQWQHSEITPMIGEHIIEQHSTAAVAIYSVCSDVYGFVVFCIMNWVELHELLCIVLLCCVVCLRWRCVNWV